MRISEVAAAAKKLPPSGLVRVRETVFCPMLPNEEGTAWGRDCVIRKLHPADQLTLMGRVNEGVLALQVEGETREQFIQRYSLPELDSANARAEFLENAWLLTLACVEPSFEFSDSIAWLSNDEIEGIAVGDVSQFLIFKIRALNDQSPGLEDVAGGMASIRKMPAALEMLEQAYMKGGDALDLLLEGKVPESQKEMADFISKWGSIISAVAFGVLRKQAKIQADETATALLDKFIDFALSAGILHKASEGGSG